jgi:hypothetical protein
LLFPELVDLGQGLLIRLEFLLLGFHETRVLVEVDQAFLFVALAPLAALSNALAAWF